MSHHLAVVCLAFDFLIASLHLSLPPLSDHKNSPHFAGLLEILADFHEPFGIIHLKKEYICKILFEIVSEVFCSLHSNH